MKVKAVIFSIVLAILSGNAFANLCPAVPFTSDGCTTQYNGYDFANYVPDVRFVKEVFNSSCQAHDKCYTTLGADKASCDSAFRSDSRNTCDKKFNKYLMPGENAYCKSMADAAYYVVASIDNATHRYNEAQNYIANQNLYLNYRVQTEQCFTTPKKSGIYSPDLESFVNQVFLNTLARVPSQFELFDMLSKYSPGSSKQGWQNAVYASVVQINYVPPIARSTRVLSDSIYQQQAYNSQGNGLTYTYRLNEGTAYGPVFSFNYNPYPRTSQTFDFTGALIVRDAAGRKDFTVIDDTLFIRGLCSDENSRICSQIP